jgi:hypothetical protein
MRLFFYDTGISFHSIIVASQSLHRPDQKAASVLISGTLRRKTIISIGDEYERW